MTLHIDFANKVDADWPEQITDKLPKFEIQKSQTMLELRKDPRYVQRQEISEQQKQHQKIKQRRDEARSSLNRLHHDNISDDGLELN